VAKPAHLFRGCLCSIAVKVPETRRRGQMVLRSAIGKEWRRPRAAVALQYAMGTIACVPFFRRWRPVPWSISPKQGGAGAQATDCGTQRSHYVCLRIASASTEPLPERVPSSQATRRQVSHCRERVATCYFSTLAAAFLRLVFL